MLAKSQGDPMTRKPLTIDPYHQPSLEKKIAQMNRRAAKLGLEPIVAEFVERIDSHSERGGIIVQVLVLDVYLTGTAPKLNGWTLICRIEHTEAGNLVSGPTGIHEDLSAWFDAKPECDHCNTDRARRDTFVLRNEAGEVVRVGRNCLADFVRSESAVKVAMAALWGDFFAPSEDSEGGWGHYRYSIITIVAYSVAAIRVDGAYRGSKSESGTTRGTVDFALSQPRSDWKEEMQAEWRSLQATEADVERAKLVIEWAKEQSGSDYAHNLSVACNMLAESDRTRGLLVSAPAAYAKAIGDIATRDKLARLPKITPKSGRYQIDGIVKTIKLQENDFGSVLKMLIVVETDVGTWNGWSTVPSGLNVSEGDNVSIKATVQPKSIGFAILSRPTLPKVTSKVA